MQKNEMAKANKAASFYKLKAISNQMKMVFDGRRLGMWPKYKQTNKTIQNRLLHWLGSLFSTTPYLNDFPPLNVHGWVGEIMKWAGFRRYFAILWTETSHCGRYPAIVQSRVHFLINLWFRPRKLGGSRLKRAGEWKSPSYKMTQSSSFPAPIAHIW